jgi:hypothetical protein
MKIKINVTKELSPSSSAEVKNEWSCTSAPPLYFNGMDRDNFTTKEVVGRRKHKKAMTRAAVHTLKGAVCTGAASQAKNCFLYSFKEAEEIVQD